MIVTVLVVVLACLAGLAVLRPFASGGAGALHADADPDEDLRRGLLRQLRDLDDELAAGKLTDDEHATLRAPVETEAIAVLRRIDKRIGSGELATGLREIRKPTPTTPVPAARRRLRIALGVTAGVVVLGGVVVLLAGTVSPRRPGAGITGGVPGAAAANPAAGEIAQAKTQVKQHPRDVDAHLALAQAYIDAGQNDQAAIEYLAITQLQPDNAAAGTGLAVIAFQDGHAADAEQIVTKVLAAQPRYPEALYTRGVIELMGLNQTGPAKRDLDGYLKAAPFGSHQQAVRSLLGLIAQVPAK